MSEFNQNSYYVVDVNLYKSVMRNAPECMIQDVLDKIGYNKRVEIQGNGVGHVDGYPVLSKWCQEVPSCDGSII